VDAVAVVRLAALGLGLAGVLGSGVGIRRSRGERPLAPLSLLLGCAGLAVGAALAVLLPPITFHDPLPWLLLGGGAIAGLVGGLLVHVQREPRGTVVRGGAWHFLPAAIALLALQVAGLAGSLDAVVLATAATVTCVAFAVAATSVVVIRGTATRARPGETVTVPAPGGVPPVLAPAAPGGARPAAAPVRITCGSCGAPVAPGWRHCVSCGSALAWA
jgi:hypothetical protein